MVLDDKTKNNLESYICECIDGLLNRKRQEFGSVKKTDASFKPFHMALLSDNLIRMADFERSFSTVMGLIFEGCARIIAETKFVVVKPQRNLTGNIPTKSNAEIDRVITEINKGNIFSNYEDEVRRIVEFTNHDSSADIEKSVITDLYVRDKNGDEVFFEMKTPKPNKEQCLNITRKHLWIHSIVRQSFPKTKTYYAMSYNPYGEEGNQYKHSFSTKYMDVKNQVLIGKPFWDFLGGKDTYEELLQVFSKVGVRKTVEIKKLVDKPKSPDKQHE